MRRFLLLVRLFKFILDVFSLRALFDYFRRPMENGITTEAASANFDLFYRRYVSSIQALEKAISADENPLNTKRPVLTFYNKALRELQQALLIRPERCPANRRQSMENYRSHGWKNCISVS